MRARSSVILELRDLVKHYPAAELVRAIDGISLTVEAGEFVALYGPSGSGKSTLLELIAGLITPDSGSVLFDGQDISRFSDKQKADYMLTCGLVGQPRTLLDGALAWESAAVKLWRVDPRGAKKTIRPLMARLGLQDRMNFRTRELSEGEQDRVMLAQALSTSPRLLLADEPTAHLDSERKVQIWTLLQEIRRDSGTAVVLATHDRQAAEYADHVYELGDGRLQHQPSIGAL